MTDYLLSVIVPCYNYGRYLPDAIHSLLGGPTCLGEFQPQTFQNFDIIIINDASTDDTDAVAKSFVNERIKYIANDTNLGTAATVNAGIRQSSGRLITYLSADDMMEPTRLEKMVKILSVNNHRFVYDDMRVFNDKGRTDSWPMGEYDFDKTLYKNQIHSGIMYPRAAWQECGGYPEIMKDGREDWAFNVALGSHGWCGVRIKEALYLYRRAGQNRSLGNAGPVWRATFLHKMEALYPDLYRGERPPMCCGNGNKRSVNVSAQKVSGPKSATMRNAAFTVGENGMVELEYLLPKAGHVMYTGAVTRAQYSFSMSRKRGWVDARDAPALLSRIEDRRHAFKLVEQPVIVPLPAAPEVATAAAAQQAAPGPSHIITQEIAITEVVPQDAPRPVASRPRKPRKPSA